jgi:single-strand DNA-binding protein
MKLLLVCKPQQEQYTNKDGVKVNTVKFIVEDFEFCESKNSGNNEPKPSNDDFVSVPDNVGDMLPFA